ncbi:MAG: GNAT family N-acetyltransferase [Erythrobacter sp.]|uniref:GNAT family N-acetyltransferase n=1 Tax=Erythrobacter sp. TaxID=1042 RepID=UPI00263815C5|nr:GNAT family N-acetyltransferase [Erythrobacter sp.]MDJ0979572.1 GNAT family N-acetyltransferase [Erythrobacter sp.]
MAHDSRVTITHEARGRGGRYTAHVEGEAQTGYLDWEPTDERDVRVATHTIVPRAIGGRGVAAQLVNRLIADARDEGFRIVPQCRYVARKFDENPDWAPLKA